MNSKAELLSRFLLIQNFLKKEKKKQYTSIVLSFFLIITSILLFYTGVTFLQILGIFCIITFFILIGLFVTKNVDVINEIDKNIKNCRANIIRIKLKKSIDDRLYLKYMQLLESSIDSILENDYLDENELIKVREKSLSVVNNDLLSYRLLPKE